MKKIQQIPEIIRYSIPIAAVTAAVLLTQLIHLVITLNPTPLIIAAVIVSAWYGGKYPGLLACLLCDLAVDFFFQQPLYEFTLEAAHIVRLGVLVVISLLTSARKKTEDKLKLRQKQQAAIAELGQRALSAIPLQKLFEETIDLVNNTLETDCCAIYRLDSTTNKLVFVAGKGWQEKAILPEIDFTQQKSLMGYVLSTENAVTAENFQKESRFTPSKMVLEHQLKSGLGVIIMLRNGNYGVLEAFNYKIRSFSQDDANFMQSVANVLSDAVERMQAEETVKEQREWLRTTLASIGDAVIATDCEGQVTFMNPVAEDLTGWTETAAIGKQLEDVFHIIDEKNRHEVESPVAKVMREGVVVGLANHTILISKDGREIPIDDSGAPIKDQNNNITGVVLVFHDITERNKAEKEQQFMANAAGLMTASLDLEKMLNGLAELTVPVLADLCIIDLITKRTEIHRLAVAPADSSKTALNEAVRKCSKFDLSAQTGIPKVLRTGIPELYSETAGCLSAELVCGTSDADILPQLNSSSAMIVPLIAGGRILGAISFLMTDSGRHYQASDQRLAEDFSHRAALAIENAMLYKTVREANRIKDEFLATLSHELRTPLNSILGWSSLLYANNYPPEQVRNAIEIIERNARLQKQIVEDVLDVSRIITGKLRLEIVPVDVESIIWAAIETIRPSALAKEIDITFLPESEIPTISADPGRLQQIMWNLLSNAVKFTPKGGQITIDLERFESSIRIKVTDTGAGISPEFLPFVFDRFKQADSSQTRTHGGLGLGLAIVRYIAELHGGEVKAESSGENSGSTFIVNLPIMPFPDTGFDSSLQVEIEENFQPADNPADLKNVRILVVEDDADSQTMIAVILQQYGASVKAVSSSAEALAVLQNDAEKPDVLISDIGMPDEDGYTFIKKVRASGLNNGGQIPAIALTAYAREIDREYAFSAGFQMHLAKPIDPSELISAVKSLIT